MEEEEEEQEKKMGKGEQEVNVMNCIDEEDGERREVQHSVMNTYKNQTSYYCKTCSGEPSLCPVPCFELYHTKLIYKTALELETQGEISK